MIIISLATVIYGVGPLIADLSITHVFHPYWAPHARFHMVWLLAINSSIAMISLCFIWIRTEVLTDAFLGLSMMISFWIAVLSRSFTKER